MQTDVKKVFYFHADANALGGYLENPFRFVPSQASVSLPSVGGYASTRAHDFKFEEIVRCRSTYTHVTGRPTKTNGPWTARVTAVVEGLEILGCFRWSGRWRAFSSNIRRTGVHRRFLSLALSSTNCAFWAKMSSPP